MLDDSLLSDDARLLEADRAGALRAVASAGAQVRASAAAATEAGIGGLAGLHPRAVVLLGRPGPTEAALRVVATLLTPVSPVPVLVSHVAPPWLGPLDVLVAGHRGLEADPEEMRTAESVHRGARRGAQVVLCGPAEGPVAAAGAGAAMAVVPRLPPAADPEAVDGLDTATVLGTAFAVASALDLLVVEPGALADALDAEAGRDGPRGESFVNPAKSLALRLGDRTPVLWGTDPVGSAVAAYAVTVLAAHAGVVGHADALGPAGGSALAARLASGSDAQSVFADPFEDPPAAPAPRLVLVGAAEDVASRRGASEAAARWPVSDTVEVDDVDLAGDTAAATALRAGVLALRWDFAALYLGLATGAGARVRAG